MTNARHRKWFEKVDLRRAATQATPPCEENLDAAHARIAELEAALQFYADPANYWEHSPGHWQARGWAGPNWQDSDGTYDDGETARAVLAATPRTEGQP